MTNGSFIATKILIRWCRAHDKDSIDTDINVKSYRKITIANG